MCEQQGVHIAGVVYSILIFLPENSIASRAGTGFNE